MSDNVIAKGAGDSFNITGNSDTATLNGPSETLTDSGNFDMVKLTGPDNLATVTTDYTNVGPGIDPAAAHDLLAGFDLGAFDLGSLMP